MSSKTTVGMVLALTPEDHALPTHPAYRFEFLKQHYYESLEEYGVIAVGIPATLRHSLAATYCDMIDALLVIGGEDIHPEMYGEDIDPRCKPRMPRRDSFEAKLIRKAHELRIPIFGVCRGLQMLNVAFGGSLYQDLADHPGVNGSKISHAQVGELDFSTSHTVELVAGTRLHSLIERDVIETNTCHHQAVREIGMGLTIAARTADGVVEAIEEGEDGGFTMAVQWHPEVWPHDPVSKSLIGGFCAAAEAYRRRV